MSFVPLHHRYHPPAAWLDLLERVPSTPLDVLERDAAAFPAIARQNDDAWIEAHRGRPDPRLRLVRYLRLGHATAPRCRHVLADPNVAEVVGLELSSSQIGIELPRALAASPIRALEVLSLIRVGINPGALAALAACPQVQRLRVLDLSSNRGLGSDGFAGLVRFPGLADLEELVLQYSADKVSDDALAALAAVPFTRLRSFSLANFEYGSRDGRARPFLTAPAFGSLVRLSLSELGVTDEDLALLARSPMLDTLEELDLTHSSISAGALVALLRAARLRRLRSLHLRGAPEPLLTPEVAHVITTAPWFEHLADLQIDDAGGNAIVQAARRGRRG